MIPDSCTPRSITTNSHSYKRQVSKCKGCWSHSRFSGNVIGAHPLPSWERVRMNEADPCSFVYRFLANTFKVLGIVAYVTMTLSITFLWKDYFCDQYCVARCAN